jgi:phage gp36-like protein
MLTKVSSVVMADADVQTWVDAADDMIDSKLYGLYSVPFSTTPLMINQISKMWAAYYILKVVYSAATPEQSNWMNTFKENANGLLNDIINGHTPLIDSTGSSVSKRSGAGIESTTSNYRPVFTEGDASDWKISEDKISDLNNKHGG